MRCLLYFQIDQITKSLFSFIINTEIELRHIKAAYNKRQMRATSGNMPTFQPQQTLQQKAQQQQLTLLQRIVRKFYFIHLIFIALIYTYLLVEYSNFKMSFTFILLGIYCYMIIWNWVINFLLVVLGMDNVAVIFNRVIIRFIIIIFFPIGITTLIAQNYLGIQLVLELLLYLCLISFLFFIYEIYGCTYGQPSNPKYIFQPNDLYAETQKVWEIRKVYNKQIMNYRQDNQLSASERIGSH